VWLDARSRGAPVVLRIEDLDPNRAQRSHAEAICRALQRMRLDFDAIDTQSQDTARHAAALDRLAGMGLLYACRCTRSVLAARRSPGSGYDNACRVHPALTPAGWRSTPDAVRVRLPAEGPTPHDVGGYSLAPPQGDPVVRRRDGSIAYVLASIVDDAAREVGHVVRGRDLAPTTTTQAVLQHLLGLSVPTFRHHLLVLQPGGSKWSKSDGSGGPIPEGRALCGRIAHLLGLARTPEPIAPDALLAHFSWHQVRTADVYADAGARLCGVPSGAHGQVARAGPQPLAGQAAVC
jgi:glutamyl-tRNA synthetase/glutamyl-Q tRNA(Asp) synthetase